MKLWVIKAVRYEDDRCDTPMSSEILGGHVWLSKKACQYHCEGYNIASDFCSYEPVALHLVFFDKRYLTVGLPRTISFHWGNWKSKMKMRWYDLFH